MKIKTIAKAFLGVLGTATATTLINLRTNIIATNGTLLKSTAEDYYEWKGCKIYYQKFGSTGRPIILLHDLQATNSAEEWKYLIPELANNHRVYVLDLLGCGRSDKPKITYTNFIYVELLLDFIKSNICEKTYLIASHDTAEIAVMAAAYDQSKLSGIACINPPSFREPKRQYSTVGKLFKKILYTPIFGTLLYNILFSKKRVSSKVNKAVPYLMYDSKSKECREYYEASHLQDSNGRFLYASSITGYLPMDIAHALHTISLPIDVYYSAGLKNSEEIARKWKRLNHRISPHKLNTAGLYPQMEVPTRLAVLLDASIKKRC